MSATHKHHRRLRSQGGGGHPSNILHISPELHNLIHAHPEVAYRHGLLVHSWDDPALIEVDIPAFLAELGHEHEHKASCEFCGEEVRVKPKRKKFADEQRRARRTISIKVPADRENGGEVWDEILALVKDKLVRLGLYSEDDAIPNYEALIAALYDWAVLSVDCERNA